MIAFRLPRLENKLYQPNVILFLLWLFLLVFPKGGIKSGGVPLTWGYFLLGFVSFISLFRTIFLIHIPRTTVYLLIIPFQIIASIGMLINGIEGGFAISFIINFFLFPWCFFILLSDYIESLDLSFFLKLIKLGIFFISAYGIFLFIFKLCTGKFIEIPFLTVNFHDFGEIESKHIDRGTVFKLISTYNNGNIYGVCLLMLLPLYSILECKKWKKFVVILSLLLTLSRTIWIGLIFAQFIISFIAKKFSFVKVTLGILIALLGILAVTFFFGFNFSFLFDANLGGRKEQLLVLQDMSLFPKATFINIGEIAYLGVLANFGVLGLLAFLLCMSGPIFIGLSYKHLTELQKALLCGLANYLLVSCSDAALLYIPVLAFYWFLSSFLFRRSWNLPE